MTASTTSRRLIERIGDPLDWDEVVKALIVEALIIIPALVFLLRAGFLLGHPDVEPYVSRSTLERLQVLGIVYMGIAILSIPVGLAIRHDDRSRRIFLHTLNQSWWFGAAILVYVHGAATTPVWLLIPTLGLLSLLIFDERYAFSGLASGLAALWIATIAERAGWLPYAPFFETWPETNGRVANEWLWSSMIWPTAVSILTFSVFAFLHRRSRNQAAQIASMSELLKQMFGRYMSTEVMNALLEDPSALELGGERRRVTIMLTDLRGFTQFVERMSPEAVLSLLNDYFAVMIDVCLKYGGTINEIVGDALLVTFGAPQDLEDHAAAATACAIEMQNSMGKVNEANEAQGYPKLEMGIGLNTAEVVVGNIGSERRQKYGVVGSGVNLASRIESYSVGGQVLASESVVEELGSQLRIDNRQVVTPKGTRLPLAIHEVGAIGAGYDVELRRDEHPLKKLAQRLHIRLSRVDGKHVESVADPFEVSRLSLHAVELPAPAPFAPLDDVAICVVSEDKVLDQSTVYGKVCADSSDPTRVRIDFTAVPPEVRAFFEQVLAA